MITWKIEKVKDHDVARIDIEPSSYPVYDRKRTNESFWYRIPGSTIAIESQKELNRIMATRWGIETEQRDTSQNP